MKKKWNGQPWALFLSRDFFLMAFALWLLPCECEGFESESSSGKGFLFSRRRKKTLLVREGDGWAAVVLDDVPPAF